MGEWGDAPPTFDRQGDAWGAGQTGWTEEGEGGGEQDIELIGTELWVAGTIDLGRFRRVSDFVNIVQGYLIIRDVVVLTQAGETTRLTMPELRVLPDDVAIVGQLDGEVAAPPADSGLLIEKHPHRLVVLTRSHMIDGEVFLHGDGSVMSFVDATDPKFIPMTDVRVRWLHDRRVAVRYPFALVQRSQILGVAVEGVRLGDTASAERRTALLRAHPRPTEDDDEAAGSTRTTDAGASSAF